MLDCFYFSWSSFDCSMSCEFHDRDVPLLLCRQTMTTLNNNKFTKVGVGVGGVTQNFHCPCVSNIIDNNL